MGFPFSDPNLHTDRALGTVDPAGDHNAVAAEVEAIEHMLGYNTTSALTPTKWRFSGGTLQKQDPGSTSWSNFLIRGLNFGPTPPGFNPNVGMPYDGMSNLSQVKWFAEQFSAVHGNCIRTYFAQNPSSGSQGPMGMSDIYVWRKALDILYAHGIYVLIDVYVNFYSVYNTPALLSWYQNSSAQAMLKAVAAFKDHPAVIGYLFGNENNASYTIQSPTWTLAKWWAYANKVGGEIKQLDTNHIVGISSGMSSDGSISDCLAAENGGLLTNFDFHGSNTYRGGAWVKPIEGTTDFFSQWTPSNNKPIIITETGVDAFNNSTGLVDQATQASATQNLWNTFDQTKCPGIFFLASNDEYWKTGTSGTTGDNATVHGTSGEAANSDSFYVTPDQFANEQYWGWWTVMDSMPYANPPTARTVVSAMGSTW